MAEFMVNFPALKSKREQLQSLNDQLKTKRNELETVNGNLRTMWEGDSQVAFDNAVKTDIIKIDEFITLINDYCRAIDEIITGYMRAEQQNLDTATTRTY